jgi:hypothetical protein
MGLEGSLQEGKNLDKLTKIYFYLHRDIFYYCPCLTFLHSKYPTQWQSSSVSQSPSCSFLNPNCDKVGKQHAPTTQSKEQPEKECGANSKLIIDFNRL